MTIILLFVAAAVIGYVLYTNVTSETPDYMTQKSASDQEECKSEQPILAEKLPEETASTAEAQQELSAAEAQEEHPAAEAEDQTPAIEGDEQTVASDPTKITEFRNPETGESAANPSNYRFAKKWVKQAMVDEGLLEKVYRNKELKGATDKKVKEALNKFKQLEKYHG